MKKTEMIDILLNDFDQHQSFFQRMKPSLTRLKFTEYLELVQNKGYRPTQQVYKWWVSQSMQKLFIVLRQHWRLFPADTWDNLLSSPKGIAEVDKLRSLLFLLKTNWHNRPKFRKHS